MFVLVVNCGSSSIKYQLYDVGGASAVSHGTVARIGEAGSYLEVHGPLGTVRRDRAVTSHAEGFDALVALLRDPQTAVLSSLEQIVAVGHRVVHGGDRFVRSALITDDVVAEVEACVPLAPLHNPANLAGIRAARSLLPAVPQVAVFDTTFHQTIPPKAFLYALPRDYYAAHHVRRYGFHGTSYRYVSARAAALLGRDAAELRLVVCHLGNGCSMAAISGGRSIDTTMGMTPVEGLVMGTRSGDVDPGILLFLQRQLGLSADEVDDLLNERSGLLALSGASNDMRVIVGRAAEGDERSREALEVFAYRAKKYVGAYAAAMGGIDAVVFTGGIGENQAVVRDLVCDGLDFLGIRIDGAANAAAVATERDVGAPGAPVRVLVVPTDEERMIVLDTLELAGARPSDAAAHAGASAV